MNVAPDTMSQKEDKIKGRRVVYTVDEIKILIQLWSDSDVQRKFTSTLRHNVIWDQLATKMNELGFKRTPSEIKNKINNLKSEYRKLKPSSGSETPSWVYYEDMHAVLGQRDAYNEDLVEDTLSSCRAVRICNSKFGVHPTPQEGVTEEARHPERASEYIHATKRARISMGEEAGTSGTSSTSATPDCVEVDDEETQDLEHTQTTPTQKKITRIPRSSNRKSVDENHLISYLKSSEAKYMECLEKQTNILQELLDQEKLAKEREERMSNIFIDVLNTMTAIMKKRECTPTPLLRTVSPPIRLPSPGPSSNSPPPRFVLVRAPSTATSNRSRSISLSSVSSMPSPQSFEDVDYSVDNK